MLHVDFLFEISRVVLLGDKIVVTTPVHSFRRIWMCDFLLLLSFFYKVTMLFLFPPTYNGGGKSKSVLRYRFQILPNLHRGDRGDLHPFD